MLSLREKLAQGLVETAEVMDIPKKKQSLGIITEEGYCDFNVPELDKSYIEKDSTKALRMESSTRARKQRKEQRKYRSNGVTGH